MNWDEIIEISNEDFVFIGNHSHSHEYLIKYNFEINPAVSGRPARLNEQRTKQKKVIGISLPRPDKLFIVTLFLM